MILQGAFSRPRKYVKVLGGGLIGMNVALALLDREFEVEVIDRLSPVPPASWGHAGRIATELADPFSSWRTLLSLPRYLFRRDAPVSLPPGEIAYWLPFGLRFARAALPGNFARGQRALGELLKHALPAWRRRLHSIGRSDLLLERASCSVWESAPPSTADLANETASASATPRQLEDHERAQLRDLFSAPFSRAVCFEGTAQISDPGELLSALRTAFEALGGKLRQVNSLPEEYPSEQADVIVVAAGIGSAGLLRQMGQKAPLIAERGYHVQFEAPSWPFGTPSITFEDRFVVVTRFRHFCRATSFVELARPDSRPDEHKWKALVRHLRELGIATRGRFDFWLGSRPTLPDYLPAIGQNRHNSRIFYAFGHQHLGLTLAAVTGELIAAAIAGEPPIMDLRPFDLSRFEGAMARRYRSCEDQPR